MNAQIANFSFDEQLVRVVTRDGEPWFAGKDVCVCLGIKDHVQAVEGLDEDERGRCSVPTSRGERAMVIISEPGVYRLVFRSRKPEAERFKRWLAHDVLPALRRHGTYGTGYGLRPDPEPPPPSVFAHEGIVQRLTMVREARMLFGNERARALWRHLALPDVAPPPRSAIDDARACLKHLLDAVGPDDTGTVRELLEAALDHDEVARVTLISMGIRAMPEADAFVVSTRHPAIQRVFQNTDWEHPVPWTRVLRRLPQVTASTSVRWPISGQEGSKQRSLVTAGVQLPGDLLDIG